MNFPCNSHLQLQSKSKYYFKSLECKSTSGSFYTIPLFHSRENGMSSNSRNISYWWLYMNKMQIFEMQPMVVMNHSPMIRFVLNRQMRLCTNLIHYIHFYTGVSPKLLCSFFAFDNPLLPPSYIHILFGTRDFLCENGMSSNCRNMFYHCLQLFGFYPLHHLLGFNNTMVWFNITSTYPCQTSVDRSTCELNQMNTDITYNFFVK